MPPSAQFLRGLFLLLMASASLGKLLDMPGFYAVVASYRSLPQMLIAPAAWALSLAEAGLALWLLLGRQLRGAALLLVLMHLMYLGWLIAALLRGLQLDNCGCFGAYLARPLSWFSPLEDLSLLVLATLFFHLAGRRPAR